MTTQPQDNSIRIAAVWTAWLAGILLAATAVLVAVNYSRLQAAWPVDSARILSLKAQLHGPGDAKSKDPLLAEIRQEDLVLRSQYAALTRRQLWGSYLLLAEAAVLAGALHLSRRRKAPAPLTRESADAQVNLAQAFGIRRAVGVMAIACVAAGAVVYLAQPAALPASASPDAAAASPSQPPGDEEIARNWPRFRGPDGSGIVRLADIPQSWDGPSGKNILWKAAIPLPGVSSPVVWGQRVFLTGATAQKREVYALDAATGAMLWQQDVQTPRSPTDQLEPMEDTGFAAPTPLTDGRCVAAIFANGDLACFDVSGKRLWVQSFGPLDSTYGHASSLAMHKNLLIVLLDQGSPEDHKSKLLAMDLLTGKTLWQAKRNVGASWASPIVAQTPTGPQVITCSTTFVIAYDADSGKELWKADVLSPDVAPSPVYAGGMVFAVNASAKLAAIRTDGSGDVTATHVTWSAEDGLPDIVSPLADGQYVLLITSGGKLSCYHAADGKPAWVQQLEGLSFRASPSLVGDKLYLPAENGTVLIAQWGGEFKELSRNAIADSFKASPAFAEGRIFLRGKDTLYCIGSKP